MLFSSSINFIFLSKGLTNSKLKQTNGNHSSHVSEQNLSSSSTSSFSSTGTATAAVATAATETAAATSESALNLNTLLIKKEKQQHSNLPNESQFKPINSSFNTDNTNCNEEDDEDDEEIDSSNQLIKLQMPLTTNTPNSSSSSCNSPVNSFSSFEPINTADIAQKVRDLLSVHNIGQRVFAKFILGLSQGTVSELLSKPKHWDKLTEKGRESYRKMYTWSCSEQSINKLKAISPRKGNKDNYFYNQNGMITGNGMGGSSSNINNTGCVKEDAATEERIAQILNEAQKQMKASGIKVPGMRVLNVIFILYFYCNNI